MRPGAFFVAGAAALVSSFMILVAPATAVFLTFDDFAAGGQTPLPNGYGNLNWTNMSALDVRTRGSQDGYVNGLVSPYNVAFNAQAQTAQAYSGTPFTFNGAYFTGAWRDGLNITVKGYSGNNLLYSQVVVVDTASPTYFTFNYEGIDKLSIASSGGVPHPGFSGSNYQFVMDDFRYDEPLNDVPESSYLTYAGLAVCGLIALRTRARRGSSGA